MGKRIGCLKTSIFMVIALLMVSCGPKAATPTPAAPATPTPTQAPITPTPVTPTLPLPTTTLAPATEKPKYGGTITAIRHGMIGGFDSAASPLSLADVPAIIFEQLVYLDWSKGLAGSGEVNWASGANSYEHYGPQLAESWTIPEVGTWILKIRKGVHFALDPASEASRLVNGRELTTDDIVWNIERYTHDPAFPNANTKRSQGAMARALTVQKTGPWEVPSRSR